MYPKVVRNATFSDVLAYGVMEDCCVVLPTLTHATFWWPRVIQMFEDRQPVNKTTTSVFGRRTGMYVRLWVPYEPSPTMPFDFVHEDVFRVRYLCLFGLTDRRWIKWI
jgi:hypothetical protein